jgi:hypothetical protein
MNEPGSTAELKCTTKVKTSEALTGTLGFVQTSLLALPGPGFVQDQPAGAVTETNVVF